MSVESTSPDLRKFRFRLGDFLVRMWLLLAFWRRTFPLPVILKRLAAPRLVLILGILPPRILAVPEKETKKIHGSLEIVKTFLGAEGMKSDITVGR